MKKTLTALIASTVAFGTISPSFAEAKSLEVQQNDETNENQNSINVVKQYVQVNENGEIEFSQDTPTAIYEEYELEKLQKHFDELNEKVHNNEIRINNDLSIQELAMSTKAAYGSWTYHWWGYDMNLNNAQTKEQIYQWNTIANAGSLAAAGGAFIAPPAALISGVAAAYFGQMASSAERHNNGNGIYIKVYWSQVFFIEPL